MLAPRHLERVPEVLALVPLLVRGRVIGVMKNFHFDEMQSKIEPLAIYISGADGSPQWGGYALLRVAPGDIPAAIEGIRKAWTAVNPLYPFDVRFLNERMAWMDKAFANSEAFNAMCK